MRYTNLHIDIDKSGICHFHSLIMHITHKQMALNTTNKNMEYSLFVSLVPTLMKFVEIN